MRDDIEKEPRDQDSNPGPRLPVDAGGPKLPGGPTASLGPGEWAAGEAGRQLWKEEAAGRLGIHLLWVSDSPLGFQGQRVPPNPSFLGPHPQAVCCTREGPGRGTSTGRQTGSRWERDEDGAREQPGGPRRPGSLNTALGRSVGKGRRESTLKLGEPKMGGPRREGRGRGSRWPGGGGGRPGMRPRSCGRLPVRSHNSSSLTAQIKDFCQLPLKATPGGLNAF